MFKSCLFYLLAKDHPLPAYKLPHFKRRSMTLITIRLWWVSEMSSLTSRHGDGDMDDAQNMSFLLPPLCITRSASSKLFAEIIYYPSFGKTVWAPASVIFLPLFTLSCVYLPSPLQLSTSLLAFPILFQRAGCFHPSDLLSSLW